jgi:hypothetical protein
VNKNVLPPVLLGNRIFAPPKTDATQLFLTNHAGPCAYIKKHYRFTIQIIIIIIPTNILLYMVLVRVGSWCSGNGHGYVCGVACSSVDCDGLAFRVLTSSITRNIHCTSNTVNHMAGARLRVPTVNVDAVCRDKRQDRQGVRGDRGGPIRPTPEPVRVGMIATGTRPHKPGCSCCSW